MIFYIFYAIIGCVLKDIHAALAQQVERIHGKDEAAGSIPASGLCDGGDPVFLCLDLFTKKIKVRPSPDFDVPNSPLMKTKCLFLVLHWQEHLRHGPYS